ncbi:class I SAM-dependent methyltransferase [Billgrantia desiderata]|uniref:Class I SAM-dependent methyltransferase n=1 Tax=Billgrantia desiderata TaxID=52021 RepID=A0ABS9B873_9GAMM|nr:class I SAM-dependent methyltransferase [Halomonas desiderata]MCE8011765.1 class I SAM-dependent methyltransferase [Halomonas desiderata]MCE8043514.1 class I SAM-dependent methyltransferase [Halomonas desiderata]MCE8048088.1 class I SAM-dependent methyltransferase [Halomonas desiderata]OUE38823.1 methyltransferase [Halomonas desiderata SP1]
MPTCPLCACPHSRHFHRDARRDYYRCDNCRLVFVPPEQRLSPEQERAVYDQHQNRPDDPGYRRFLSRLFEPLQHRLAPGASGLDFGAGPGPTLSLMFEEAGHPMAIYDPFYAPDASVLERRYDFITATEVVEHLFAPGRELARLAALLPSGGWLGLMTKRVTGEEAFARWHYILDPTHVCFFSEASFEWLAAHLGMSVEFPGADVALLQKK